MSYKKILLLLALLAAFPPMSTDMYLPALPQLQAQWATDLHTINLTLILFFVFFSTSLLVYGPVSDSHGRKPLLLIGIGIYTVASLLCAAAASAEQLILFRILQAMGAASASALSMAIAKDLFEAHQRQQLLAHLGVIVALAPMMAPVIGGWMLKWLSWHWIFITQAIWGAMAWTGVTRMPEPLQKKVPATFGQILGRYFRLLKNRRYATLNVLMALSTLPLFAFIAGSPAIYITHFRVSPQWFGLFFGSNALAMMAGSYACGRLTRKVPGWPLLRFGFAGILTGGLAIWLVTGLGPVAFAAAMFIITFSMGLTRPLSNNLVLEQVQQDVGAAASLLIFLYFVAGAVSMTVISLEWSDHRRVIAGLAMGSGVILLTASHFIGRHWKSAIKVLQ